MPIGIGGGSRPVRPGPVKPGPVKPIAFTPPRCELVVPDNLGRPPTLADVTVKAGFDGLAPAQAAQKVLASSTTPVAAQNTAFVLQTATDVHKAFTIAVNNAFIPGSPFAQLAAAHPNASFAILGTMSEVHPALVQMTVPGQPPALYQPIPGGYEPVAKNPYQVVMKADLRRLPPGVRISYPAWSVPALSGQLGTVTEG